jgi:Biopolymer transport protein
MKVPRRPVKKARIEIIPMIDTMFFLLVFFMMATLSMTTAESMPVDLPSAAGIREKAEELVTVTMTQNGDLFYNKEKVNSPQSIKQKLIHQQETKKLSVKINADKRVEYGGVVELMDMVKKSGVEKIAVEVEHKE